MTFRKKGAVVTVASGASTIPTPQMAIYSATKVSQTQRVHTYNMSLAQTMEEVQENTFVMCDVCDELGGE